VAVRARLHGAFGIRRAPIISKTPKVRRSLPYNLIIESFLLRGRDDGTTGVKNDVAHEARGLQLGRDDAGAK